jgi:Domain of unknown function (DUF1886).
MTGYNLAQHEVAEVAEQIYQDYWNAVDPFEEQLMPEHLVRGGFESDRRYALFLTLVASIDKRKETMDKNGKAGLWREAKELWNDEETRWIYEPQKLVERDYEELIDLFTQPHLRRFNYYEDPHVWYLNSLSLYRYFNSDPRDMLVEADYNAVDLLTLVRSDEYSNRFHSLIGEKIGPLWVRLMDEEIHELDRIHAVDIPVDTQIKTIRNKLLGTEYSELQVRDFWREVCDETEIIPVRLDRPLWLIDKFLDEGDEYLPDGQQRFESYLEELVD